MSHPGYLLRHAGGQRDGSEREMNGESAEAGWKA